MRLMPRRRQRALIAAGMRVRVNDKRAKRAKPQQWQSQCWDVYDALGEIKYPMGFLGEALARVRFRAGWMPPDADAPVPIEDAENVPQSIIDLAQQLMAQYEEPEGGQGGLNRLMGINHGVTGEGYYHVWEDVGGDVAPGDPMWEVLSIESIRQRGANWEVVRDGSMRGEPIGPSDLLVRIWNRHPRFPALPDSSVRGVLDECEELLLLGAGNRAIARSRVGNAGLLYMSTDLSLGTPLPERAQAAHGTDDLDPLVQEVIDGMASVLDDPSDASSVVPVIVRAKGKNDGQLEWIKVDRPLGKEWGDRGEQLVRRIARGLALPAEQLLGLADVNHWTAWQVERSTYEAHVEPAAMLQANGLAGTWLRPMALDAGVDFAAVRSLVVIADASELVATPDRREDALQLHGAGALSDLALAQEHGWGDEDLPDNDERLRRLVFSKAIMTADLVLALGQAIGVLPPDMELPDSGGDDSSSSGEGDEGPGELPPGEGPPPDGPPGGESPEAAWAQGFALGVRRAMPGVQAEAERMAQALVASSGTTGARLGQRLAAMDVELRARVQAAADHALADALRRAGARLRSRAQGDVELRAQLRDVDALEVAATLGSAAVQRLAPQPDDLLNGSFDALHDRWDTWVLRAQRAALDMVEEAAEANGQELDATERAAAEQAQDEDRHAGWLLLLAALLALGRDRLFGEGAEPPSLGELDELTVQPGLVRQALARAGGATGTAGPAGGALLELTVGGLEPSGEIGTGPRIRHLLAEQARMVRAGWEWVYGDPSARRRPFEPHRALDGRVFPRFGAQTLANNEAWPPSGHLYPGDHDGCRCSFAPVMRPAPTK